MKVDPLDEANHDKPLWLVYGHEAWPSFLCCKINLKRHGYPVIWGFSVYRRSPGFRTIGQDVRTWMQATTDRMGYTLWEFYDNQDEALARLKKLTDCSKARA